MKQIQPGMHMKGHYYGVSFTGIVKRVRFHTANWRNICVTLILDNPIQTPSDIRADIYMEVRPDGWDVTGQSFMEHDWDYIDYSADADSGDSDRITPDPAGDDVTAEPDYDAYHEINDLIGAIYDYRMWLRRHGFYSSTLRAWESDLCYEVMEYIK